MHCHILRILGIECCENHEEGFSYGNILKRRSADLRGQYRTVQCGHGTILEAIAGTKRASQRTYTRDEKITYVITMNNTGPTAITTITVSDNLGQGTYDGQVLVPMDYEAGSVQLYVNNVLVPDAVVQAGPPQSDYGSRRHLFPCTGRKRPDCTG